MSRSYPEVSEKLHEYETWGVPMERQLVNEVNQANRGLALTQTGDLPENRLFATRSGRVVLIASLAISNDSRRDINVNDIVLDLPFFALDFHVMQMPTRAAGLVLPTIDPCQFERSELLNARLGRKFLICSGLSVEGLLLCEGSGMVPKEYRQGSEVPVELTVFASKGRRYAIWMTVLVERQDQERKQSRLCTS